MPYIRLEAREYFSKLLKVLSHIAISNPGELNFLITELVNQYHVNHAKNYQVINDVVGALEGAKLEYYRRIASPYENVKVTINGDVYKEETLK